MITAYEDLLIPKEKLSEKVEEIVNSRHYLSIVNFHDDGPTTSTTVCSSPEGEALSHISPRLSNSVGIPNKGPVEKPEEPKTNHRGSDDELEDSRWLLLQHRNYSFDSGSAVGCYTLKGARIIGNRIKVKPCEMKFKKSPLTGNLLTSLLFVIIFVLSLTIVALLTILIVVSTKESRTTANNETCFIPTTQPPPVDKPYYQLIWQNLPEQSDISNLLMSSFKPLNIRNNIRWLSERVHVAGTYENAQVMSRIAEQYRNYGFDVKIYDYNVLLSYPDYENPNKIDYKNRGGKWEEISSGLSERIGPKEALKQQWDPRGLVYWNAYSLNGTTEGQIVYANYGTLDDYKLLDKVVAFMFSLPKRNSFQ